MRRCGSLSTGGDGSRKGPSARMGGVGQGCLCGCQAVKIGIRMWGHVTHLRVRRWLSVQKDNKGT